mgnify:CR=1 FL=1
MKRIAHIHRKTKETDISVKLNLDGTGKSSIRTGIPFLDHMLTLFAKHGLFDLVVKAKGDTQVDYHHTFEDAGICLGKAIDKALDKRGGICRYGALSLPMDEVLANVRASIDISGRPYLDFHAQVTTADKKITRQKFPFRRKTDIEYAKEFFKGMTAHARITLHIDLLKPGEIHHVNEAVFKGVAVALRQAVAVHVRAKGVSSTKGNL